MLINEIFYSIQGEGIYIGKPMAFIRCTGCNLRCKWCDTKYAYTDGKEMAITEILKIISTFASDSVCLTGGEPFIQEELFDLIDELIKTGYIVHVETNGSIPLDKLKRFSSVKLSYDIKCPSSGEEKKMILSNIDHLKTGDQVKFIIADKIDYLYAKEMILKFLTNAACEIIFTPCDNNENHKWIKNKSELQNHTRKFMDLQTLCELVLTDHLNVRVLPQLHKLIWPGRVRGV